MLKCEKCGYEWNPRDPESPPDQCANPTCKTYYWDRPHKSMSHSLEGQQRVAH
jgi:predicted Zn-ribbon and HTH transcriptional regulator